MEHFVRYAKIVNDELDIIKRYFTKHECSICGSVMQNIRTAIYVKWGSLEANNWNFYIGSRNYEGKDAYFTNSDFFCPCCKLQISTKNFSIIETETHLKWPNYYKPIYAIKYLSYVEPSYFYKPKQKKKRYCPDCREELLSSYTYKIIEPDLPEAKDYDFTIAGKKIEGRIEFRKGFFYCPNKRCEKEITFDEMKEIEEAKAKE